jgi:Zn-finger protein
MPGKYVLHFPCSEGKTFLSFCYLPAFLADLSSISEKIEKKR